MPNSIFTELYSNKGRHIGFHKLSIELLAFEIFLSKYSYLKLLDGNFCVLWPLLLM